MRTQLILRPPDEIKKWLEKQAKKKGLSVNAIAIQIFWDCIAKENQKSAS